MNTIKRPAARVTSIKATLPAPSISTALDGGLGYYDLVDRNGYTYVQVGPIPKANPGDTVTVVWADSDVVFYNIKDTDLGKTFPIPVPNASIADAGDGERVLSYAVAYHQGGGHEVSDPPVRIRVKRTVPGGLDPKPETPYNEGITLAEIQPNPVPPEATEVTIVAPLWKNPAQGDQMVVNWNGAMFFAPLLPGDPFPETVSVTLTAQDILDAGIGDAVPVTFGIHDIVANWSGWAETVEVNVRLEDPGLLFPPHVGNKDTGWTQIRLVELGGKDLDVFTPDYQGAIKDDIVIVHVRGTALDGSKVIFDSDPQPMPEPGYGLTFKVPNAKVADLAGGEVRIWYTVNGKSNSHSVWLPVIGAVQGDLPAPLVEEAVDTDGDGLADWLDPDKVYPAYVTIAYPTMARDDVVTLVLEGTDVHGTPVRLSYPQPQISTPGPITALVQQVDILKFINSQMAVYYIVSPYSRRPTFIRALGEIESEHLALRVHLASATKPHPAPVLTDHWGNGIPHGGAVGLPTTWVSAQAEYEYTGLGDEVTYTWVGPRETQTNTYRVGATGALPPAESAYSAFLERNEGGRVTASYSVRRGGFDPAEPSEKVTFRVTSYTEDFEDVPLGMVDPSKPLDLGTMKIEGTPGALWIRDNSVPPNLSRHVSLSGDSSIFFLFPDDLREVRFDILPHGDGSVPFPEVLIQAWNGDATVLDEAHITADSTWQTVTLESSTGTIRKIIYRSLSNGANFDNFVLTK